MARPKRFGSGERIPAKTASDTSSATPTYSYDANGNRTNLGDTVGSDNQISTDGTWTYTYDKEGNVTQKTDAAGDKWQYTYDNMNELVNATYTPHGTTVASTICTYVYDVFGNKIEQEETVSGVTTITKFAYDGTNVWAAMSSTNALQTRYVYMDGSTTPVAQMSSSGTVNWYDTDYEGSVRLIVSNTGSVVDTIKYDAYGNILSQSAPVSGAIFAYAGGMNDSVLQVDWFGIRVYNPADGTWLQQDPLFPLSGTNPDEYCDDDPSNEIDPTGLAGEPANFTGTAQQAFALGRSDSSQFTFRGPESFNCPALYQQYLKGWNYVPNSTADYNSNFSPQAVQQAQTVIPQQPAQDVVPPDWDWNSYFGPGLVDFANNLDTLGIGRGVINRVEGTITGIPGAVIGGFDQAGKILADGIKVGILNPLGADLPLTSAYANGTPEERLNMLSGGLRDELQQGTNAINEFRATGKASAIMEFIGGQAGNIGMAALWDWASKDYPRDFATKNTKNWSATFNSEAQARNLARQKLGRNPVEVEPGKFRSADGKWQYRAKPGDLAEGHIHLEELNPETGEVLQNLHLRWPAGGER